MKVLVSGLTVLFALSMIGMAFALNMVTSYQGQVQGVIIAVDNSAKTFSVEYRNPTMVSPRQSKTPGFVFSTVESTKVKLCNAEKDFNSLKAGQQVEVKYSYDAATGHYIATWIDVTVPIMACNSK